MSQQTSWALQSFSHIISLIIIETVHAQTSVDNAKVSFDFQRPHLHLTVKTRRIAAEQEDSLIKQCKIAIEENLQLPSFVILKYNSEKLTIPM